MLDDLGLDDSAARVRAAVERVCADGVLTRDVGGTATTAEVADAILATL
jgi:tartrate dehydrogenase/decarboxylase / D-malate dehydrogenase